MVTTDLVADVSGYFPAGADLHADHNPVRMLDTRTGTHARLANGIVAAGRGRQPPACRGTHSAAVMNVTVTNPAAAGYVTVWPCGQPQPLASNLNYVAGQTVPNLTISRLGTGGKVCFFSLVADRSGGGRGRVSSRRVRLTRPIDNPVRILDTRNGTGDRRRR